ncbi:transporter substrate-binding domain-containing protein [Kordiimonas marina]|uniref:transporter substrate-binding domain-containing protein n=1 Tax=Kordiimonas marina TaxID=2872312 RepID=UPI001FF30CEB|nr:transporter substrate-binding domain-containing protein [Kordiimonas marina]MCJ9427650.1 hypothetical protein [Kordiimonas marina]
MVKFFILSSLLAAASLAAGADDAVPTALAVTYYHYPPKLRVEGDKPTGPYAEGVERIVAKAGLKIEWLKSTINEEARMLNDGRRSFCTTGRYYTAERAKHWTFLPYLFDKIPADVVVTTQEKAPALKAHGTMASVVRDPKLIGTLLGSGIYGGGIDTVVRSSPPWIYRDGKTDFQLMHMVAAGRAHYAIVPEDQWQIARKHDPNLAKLVMLPDLGTLPPTNLYLVCSHGVTPATINRLDQAMQDLGYRYHSLTN